MTFFGKRIPLLFSLFVWFLLWELVGRAEYSIIIPPVSRVFVAAITILPTAKFAAAASISLRSFALGMALAIVIGLPVGILMARLENLGKVLSLWVNIFVSAPISALVPILMSVVGIGETTVVVTVFLFAVFVIILDTQVGIKTGGQIARGNGFVFRRPARSDLHESVAPERLAGDSSRYAPGRDSRS